MPKFKFKGIYKILFVFVMFFSCLKVVNAKNWYYKVDKLSMWGELNVYSQCNENTGCVPLCVYVDKNGNDVALIGYSYRNDDYNWQIAYFDKKLYYSNDSFIPKTYIHWEENAEDWNGTTGYSRLNDTFSCPMKLWLDEVNGDELCFENSINSCNKLNDASGLDPLHIFETMKFDTSYKLDYSFANDNFRFVMERVITNLEVHDSDAPDYELLADVDSSFQYNGSSITEENCNYFKTTLENADAYSDRIVTDDNINKYKVSKINPEIKAAAKDFNVKYPQVYYFDGLSRLLEKDANKNFRNIGGNEKNFSNVDKLFYDRLVDTMTKSVSECNSRYNANINYSESNMYDAMKTKYDEVTASTPAKIEFSDNFDCGIFNEEITDMIQTGYFIIELLSIVILIAFSVLDYAKVILNGDADQMKKSNGNLFKRIIIVVVIFLLPAILNVTLKLFKIQGFNSEHPLCIEIKK